MDCPEGFDREVLTPAPMPEGPIQSLALDLSGGCNLACRYCAESATLPPRHAMSEDTLLSAWDWFHQSRASTRSVHIGSGEPLLARPLLEQVASLADEIPVHLTTNGTLVDEEIADWLAASGWQVKVSLDGPKTVHDRWRVTRNGAGTFDRVARVVRDLAARMGTRLSPIAVFCRGTDPSALYDAVAALGARRLEIVPVVHEDQTIVPNDADLERFESFVFEYARSYRDCDPVLALGQFALYVVRVMGYKNHWVRCGAGRSYVGVGPDGGIFPCLRFIGIDRYQIGQLPEGIDPTAARAFQRGAGRTYDERARCQSCWAAPLCGGPCFACAEMFDIDHTCAMIRSEAAAAVGLVQELREHDPERLLSFLRVRCSS